MQSCIGTHRRRSQSFELYRVIKNKGILIAQIPIDKNLKKTFENKEIINRRDRNKYFGQYDHVRIYGLDFYHLGKNVVRVY